MAVGYNYSMMKWLNDRRAQAAASVAGPIAETRPAASTINSTPSLSYSARAVTGDGGTVPIVYGRRPLQGYLITAPVVSGSYRYVAIGWCLGEVFAVEQVFINDEIPGAGVEVRHYRGNTTQGVDSWLSAAIPGYTDTCVIDYRGEQVGLCYSVFKLATASVSGVLNFKAIIKGRLVYDPAANSGTDPFYDDNVISVDFENGGADESPLEQTITLHGNASIDSGGLQLDGGDNTTVTDDAGIFSWTLQGNAHLSDMQVSEGTGALRTYSTGDACTSNAAVVPASSDFTINANVYPVSLSGSVGGSDKDYILSIGTGANELSIYFKGHKLAYSFNGSETVGSTTVLEGEYSAIELDRAGDVFTLKLDGVSQGSNTHASASIQQSRVCLLALDDGSYTDVLNGYMDSLDIS